LLRRVLHRNWEAWRRRSLLKNGPNRSRNRALVPNH
jgi:hypothetical protein